MFSSTGGGRPEAGRFLWGRPKPPGKRRPVLPSAREVVATFTPHFCGVLLAKRELAQSLTMDSEDRLEGLTESEGSSSEAGTSAGSDDGADEVAPAAAAQHNYNLRTKRTALDTVEESGQTKSSSIAPGAGAEADRNKVGGRDERASGRPYGASIGAESSDAGRSETGAKNGGSSRLPSDQALSDAHGSLPRLRNERLGTTLRRRLPATPLFAGMSREELEAQSARVMAHLRKSQPERGEMLSPPTNELVTRRDSSHPSDAGRKVKSRLEPGASDLLGQVPVKPGRGLFSDRSTV